MLDNGKMLSEEEISKVSGGTSEYGRVLKISDSCVGCGACEDSCPAGAIIQVGHFYSINSSRCFGCGSCVDECVVHAIS